MSNYVASGRPFNGERNLSEVIRDEFKLVQDAIATKSESGGLSGTSITSLSITLGEKIFTMQAGKEFTPGQRVFLADSFDPAGGNMTGVLVSYNVSTGLTNIDVTSKVGSGTESSWVVGISNDNGVTLSTNAFTGSQNFARATVASHATNADIWAANGNQIDFTGAETITAFPAAPQSGSWRELICADACSFTAGTDLKIGGVISGATYTAEANDVVMVRALTTTTFLLTIQKYNGKPSMNGAGHILILKGSNGSGSTSTRILRYSSAVTNTGEGTDWNYVDSSTLGGTITTLKSGWYSVSLNMFHNSGYAGISINSSQLTTNFSSLVNDSERLLWLSESDVGASANSFFGFIPSGSVLRTHHDNAVAASANTRLIIERIL